MEKLLRSFFNNSPLPPKQEELLHWIAATVLRDADQFSLTQAWRKLLTHTDTLDLSAISTDRPTVRMLHKAALCELLIKSLHGMVPFLQHHEHLRTVNLAGLPIGEEGGELVAAVMEHNRSIRELNLSDCLLGDGAVTSLARALAMNPNSALADLFLSSNPLGDRGGVAICKIIRQCSTLECLVLTNTDIGDATSSAVLEGLEDNATMRMVVLQGSKLTTNSSDMFFSVWGHDHVEWEEGLQHLVWRAGAHPPGVQGT